MKVSLFNTSRRRVPRQKILRIVREVLQEFADGRDAVVNVVFVDDEEIRSLNQRFLGRDRPTDVIAFNLSDDEALLEGEVYVSVDTAERQAREYGEGFWGELLRLVAHGALHLVGFDDATEEQRARMHELENRFLERVRGQPGRGNKTSAGGANKR